MAVVAVVASAAVAVSAASAPFAATALAAERRPSLRVSENRRFLVREDGTPFFYLADTAWELFHRLNREEAERYLDDRARKGFTVIQAVAVGEIPAGVRSILFRYAIEGPRARPDAASIYSVRMEANHERADPTFRPIEVTFRWKEIREGEEVVERGHTEIVERLPHAKVSKPSREDWGSGDPELRKLTDGVIGPPYAGGRGPMWAASRAEGDDPVIDVDLGREERAGAFRIHLSAGWPWWDAFRGEVRDRIEVETSLDGVAFERRGAFETHLRRKDIPANHMLPDDETATGPIFELALPEPVPARFVRFRIVPKRILTVSEVEVLEWIRYEPFDLRIALPEDR